MFLLTDTTNHLHAHEELKEPNDDVTDLQRAEVLQQTETKLTLNLSRLS